MSFTSYWLKKRNIDIRSPYLNAKFPTLRDDGEDFSEYDSISLPRIKINKHAIKIRNQKLSKTIDYEQLKQLNYKIVKRDIGKKEKKKGKKVEFLLRPLKENIKGEIETGRTPIYHKVYLSEEGGVFIDGPNSINRGINPQGWQRIRHQSNPRDGNKKRKNTREYLYDVYKDERFLKEEDKYQTKKIGGIPFLYQIDGTIIAIKKSEEGFGALFTGMPGTGKTFLMHGIGERIFWYWKYPLYHLSDPMEETTTWINPTEKEEKENFINELKMIGEKPRPLPCIYIYPSLEEKRTYDKNFPSIQTSLPFKDLLDNWADCFGEMPTSQVVEQNKEKFLEFLESNYSKESLMNEINEKIKEICTSKEGKLERGMVGKMRRDFGLIIRSNTCELTTNRKKGDLGIISTKIKITHIEKEIKEEQEDGKIISDLDLTLGLLKKIDDSPIAVPIFVTRGLIGRRWSVGRSRNKTTYKPDTTFLARNMDIILKKQETLKDKTQKVALMADEVQKWCGKTTDNLARDIVRRLFAERRHKPVICLFSTQDYTRVDEEIRDKAAYCFTLRQKAEKQAKEIQKDFDLDTSDKKAILNLNKKKRECLATTAVKDGFIKYYKDGSKEYTDEPQRGYALPPLSKHLHYGK